MRSPKMMTDEEILRKATLLLEKISENSDLNTFSLLREVSDSELKAVESVLEKIAENPEGILAFDDLFGDKTRLVIPFPVKDEESELGQWVYTLEQVLEVDVDWEKGMVSAEREWDDHNTAVDDTVNQVFGDGPRSKKLKRKFQMKIGKYFAKLDDLMKQYAGMRQKIGDHKYKDRPEKGPGAVGGKHLLKYSIGETEDALQGDDLKRYYQIMNQLELYAGNTSHGRMLRFLMDYTDQDLWRQKEQHRRDMQDKGDRDHGKPVRDRKPIVEPDTKFVDMGSYWLNNSKKIREDVPGLENDKYSIIITRHPVDVMRMSDFENITSCHTPTSRGGGTGEYYKCAVAEAQGHGALVYAVETDDLLSETNTGNIESAEQELNDAVEIFGDEKRYGAAAFDIRPLGRTRLRQFRYFDWEKHDAGEDEGTQVAVPEKATYGDPPVGLVDTITRWSREKQEEVISKMPRRQFDGTIDLDDFKIYGGSYEDTSGFPGRKELLANLIDVNLDDFTGEVRQDTETEDELPPGWGGITAKEVQKQVDEIAAKWNRDWNYVHVRGEALDSATDEGAILINPDPVINFEWELDQWTKLPNSEDMTHCIEDLLGSEHYGSIPNKQEQERVDAAKKAGTYNRYAPESFVSHSNDYLSLYSYIGKMHTEGGGEEIKAIVRIDTGQLIGWAKGKEGYDQAIYNMGEEYEFEYLCKVLNLVDKAGEGLKAGIENYFKREGYFEGGAYVQLVTRIEGETNAGSYYWDVDYDGEPAEESYEAWAKISYDFDPEELGIEPRILFDLVDRREFALLLRGYLTGPAREETGTDYWLSIRDKSAVDSGGDVRYSITFKVDADTPDDLVTQFYELVTGEMDDEDEIVKAFMGALREEAAKNGVKLNGDSPAPEKVRDFEALQDLGENKQYNANYLVKTWKRFIL